MPSPSMDWRHAWGTPSASATLRTTPEDFIVEESPLAEPDGAGEHHYLWIQKRQANTEWVARQLAKFAGVSKVDVGYAGLKDRNAVTTQAFSVMVTGCEQEPDWSQLVLEGVKVLSVARHGRKLKKGMLAGNRFELCLRELDDPRQSIEKRLQQIQHSGVPNYFGPQRFGHDGNNLNDAAKMFRREIKVKDRQRRGLYLSAVRSYLFNLTLSERVREGNWNQIIDGDCVWSADDQRGTIFDSASETHQQSRQRGELIATGPLWGDGRLQCAGEALEIEQRLVEQDPLWLDGLKGARMDPMRRPLVLMPRGLQWRCEPDQQLWLSFELPVGAYATALIRELII